MRLLHLPSGKATTLYSSRNQDNVYQFGFDGSEALALKQLFDDTPRALVINWKHMRLPVASPFPRASCSIAVVFDAGEGTEASSGAFQAGPEPPDWMRMNQFGFMPTWSVGLDFGEGGHEVPGAYSEHDRHRLVHRALQALPWTD